MKKAILLILALLLMLFSCGDLLSELENSLTDPIDNQSENNDEQNPIESNDIEENNLDNETQPTVEPEKNDEFAYEITYKNARAYKSNIGTMYVQIIFEITNIGSKPIYLSSGSCDLEDKNGKLIASKTMISVYPNVINPGEKAYYYEENTLKDLEDVIDLIIIPRPKIEKAKVDIIRLSISDLELSTGNYNRGLKMIGRVENTTDKEQKMIYIAAILFGKNNIPIGQIFTIITDELKSGDKIGFEKSSLMLPDDLTIDDVESYVIYAYPNQFQF